MSAKGSAVKGTGSDERREIDSMRFGSTPAVDKNALAKR